MIKEFRCPICGCNQHHEIKIIDEINRNRGKFPFSVIEYELDKDHVDGYLDLNFYDKAKAYLCKECGHIDFFSEDLLDRICREEDKNYKIKKDLTSKISEIEERKNELTENVNSKQNRLSELEKLLANLDISVRQQRKYQEEKDDLVFDIKRLSKELDRTNDELNQYVDQLNKIQKF